jgi:hypothetical protein
VTVRVFTLFPLLLHTVSLPPCRARGFEYHNWSHLPESRPIPLRTVLHLSLSTTLTFRVLPELYAMPTASSIRSARVTRSARMAATARPIATSVGSARRPAVSLMTGVAATEVPVTAGPPVTDEQSRRPSAPEVARPETSPAAAIAELAAARDGEEITPQEPPQEPPQSANNLPLGDAFADLFGFVQTMSEEVTLIRAEVFTLKAKELASKEVIDGLRSSIQDLEGDVSARNSRRRPCPGKGFQRYT